MGGGTMSWIKKELKRRLRAPAAVPGAQAAAEGEPAAAGEAGRLAVQALWQQLETANEALPPELKLRREPVTTPARQGPKFQVWLRAPNGAAIGHAGDALRYLWPAPSRRSSSNFWIAWDAAAGHLELRQRVTPLPSPVIAHYRFDERRTGLIVKQLVLGRKLSVRALRKKRLWLF
jgi:hypothetical protein